MFSNKIWLNGILVLGLVTFFGLFAAQAGAETLRPFVLASVGSGDVAEEITRVKEALGGQDFEIVGEYSPYSGAHSIVVTSDELKATAAKSEFGGYGAAQRVSVTQVGDQVQVAYTNPSYRAYAYRMEGDLKGVTDKLAAALGSQQAFGSEKGLTEKKLRKYHYKMLMPYFDDPDELAAHGSYEEAVQAVEAGLAAARVARPRSIASIFPARMRRCLGLP